MLTPAQASAIRAWTRLQLRCRRAYFADRTEEQLQLARAKAVRKSNAQRRYRDRTETERRAAARALTLLTTNLESRNTP